MQAAPLQQPEALAIKQMEQLQEMLPVPEGNPHYLQVCEECAKSVGEHVQDSLATCSNAKPKQRHDGGGLSSEHQTLDRHRPSCPLTL